MSNSLVDADGSCSGISGTTRSRRVMIRGVGRTSLCKLTGILEAKIGDDAVWVHERVSLVDEHKFSQSVDARVGTGDILDS